MTVAILDEVLLDAASDDDGVCEKDAVFHSEMLAVADAENPSLLVWEGVIDRVEVTDTPDRDASLEGL